MNREIKFRAWDDKENKWLFGYELPKLGGFSLIGEVVLMGELSALPLNKLLHDIVFMQFTGLKDKNGVEIYEGDVVSFIDNPTGIYTGIYEVIFDASYIGLNGKDLPLYNIGAHKWVEVISNIYSNPSPKLNGKEK